MTAGQFVVPSSSVRNDSSEWSVPFLLNSLKCVFLIRVPSSAIQCAGKIKEHEVAGAIEPGVLGELQAFAQVPALGIGKRPEVDGFLHVEAARVVDVDLGSTQTKDEDLKGL